MFQPFSMKKLPAHCRIFRHLLKQTNKNAENAKLRYLETAAEHSTPRKRGGFEASNGSNKPIIDSDHQ